MTSKDVPVSQQRLFVGRGFRWDQRHTHRLMQTYRPEFRRYVEPAPAYRLTRRVLPAMVERRSGMVINVCSTASIAASSRSDTSLE